MKHFRLLSLLIALVVCLFVGAAGAEETIVTNMYEFDVQELGFTDRDEFFSYYVEQKLYGYEQVTFARPAYDYLTKGQQALYDMVVPTIKSIAAGTTASTVIDLDVDAVKAAGFVLDGSFANSTEQNANILATWQALEDDLAQVCLSLVRDHPFEFYWLAGYGYAYSTSLETWDDGHGNYTVYPAFYFYPAENFQPAGYNENAPTVDTAKTSVVTYAVTKANAIVTKYAGKTDVEKLTGYKDEICELVDYNYDALDGWDPSKDNSPWQLLWVFDDDPDTKVVCEGYSKAFQYLCDLSTFTDAECYTVTGDCGGAHMWNIVKLNGKNWLVDVTNSEPDIVDGVGAIGCDGSLFLKDPISGTVSNGYVFDTYGDDNTKYTYGSDNIWGDDVLTLGAVAIVDDIYYQDFSSALNAWTTGTTLTLLKDCIISSSLNVASTEAKTLDLNGCTLEQTSSADAITNSGTLTITGEGTINSGSRGITTNKKLIISGTPTFNCTIAIYGNGGTVNLTAMGEAVDGLYVYIVEKSDTTFTLPNDYALCNSSGTKKTEPVVGPAYIKIPNAANYVADVNGTKYEDFATALANWTDGTTLTLLQNYTLTEYKPIEANASGLVLDLNGKTLTETSLNDDIMFIGVAKTLTIKGPGTVSGGSTAISFNGEKLIIDGAVTLNGDNYELRCAYGILDLTKATNINNWRLYAGGKTITFGYDDNCDVKLPDGYAAYVNNVAVTSITSSKQATITTHTHSYTAKYDDTYHWNECACGKVEDGTKAAHTYTAPYTPNADGTTHTAACTCGATKAEDHNLTYSASTTIITKACSKCTYVYGTATISATDTTYDGTAKETANVTYSDGWTGDNLTVSYENNTNAGTATASITVDEATASVDFTIAKATLTITANAQSKTYGDVDPELTYKASGLASSDNLSNVLTGALTRVAGEDAGTYAITQGTLTAGSNYTISFTGAVLTIKSKYTDSAIVTLEKDSYQYAGTAKKPGVTSVVVDGKTLDAANYDVTYSNNTNVGTATVTISFKGNYNGEVTKSFKITKAPLTVTADNKTMTTGQDLPTFTYTITGFVNGETESVLTTKPTVTCEADGTTAGTYDITVSGAEAANYSFTYVNGTLTVADHQHAWTYTAAGNTITATCGNADTCSIKTVTIQLVDPADLTYDGTAKHVTVTQTPAGVFDNIPAVSYCCTGGCIDAKEHTATLTYGGVSAEKKFTILPRDITGATIGTFAEMTYNGAAQTPSATVTIDGLTVTGSWSPVTNVGDKSTFTANGNFTGKLEDDPNMSPKAITITGATIEDVLYQEGGQYTLNVTGVTFADVTLTLNTDYTASAVLTGENEVAKDVEATVTVTLINRNFTLSPTTFTGSVNIVEHTHVWSYAVNGDTITATCSGTIGTCPTSTVTVTLPDTTFTYDGSEKSVVPTYAPENSGLAATVSYTGERTKANTDGFTATMTLGTAEVSKKYTISPASIGDATIEDIADQVYTGEALEPEVTVKVFPDVTMVKGTDYTVAYKNNTNVGKATVTVTGQGNYTGTKTATFEITKANPTVTAPTANNRTYDGTDKPLVTAGTVSTGTLVYSMEKEGTYAATIPTATNAGTYTVWYYVQGGDNYDNSEKASVQVTIAPIVLTVNTTDAAYTKTYDGTTSTSNVVSWKQPSLDGNLLPDASIQLTMDSLPDYPASAAGSYDVEIGIELWGDDAPNYKLTADKVTVKAIIEPKPLTVTGATAASRAYDSTDKVAITTVTLDGILIVDGTADDVSVNATELMGTISGANVGNYTTVTLPELTLTGKHAANYTLTQPTEAVTTSVTISAADITGASVTAANQVYTGNELKPAVTVILGDKTLTLDTDYTVAYSNNTNVGEAAVTVTGKGNYTGTATGTFQITQSPSVVTAKSYLGDTEQSVFTYGDTITIKGQAAVDLTAAQTFDLRAAAVNTAALYYGDIKLTEYTMTDNTFTLTYDTAGKALPIGESTLTVEFGGNGNLAGTTATVTVTLNKADPEVDIPTDLKATYGQTLADVVTLPEDWAWNDDTTTPVGDAGTQTFKATYTSPVDADYYNTVVTNLNIEVARLAITDVTAPGDQALNVYCPTVEDIIAQLPKTLPGTGADGKSYNVPVVWSFSGETFNNVPEAENSFTWKALPGNNFTIPDTETGTIQVTNGKALPVAITGTDTAITYNGSTYDVSKMFTIDANAGAPTYSIVSNGTGAGTLGEDGKTLTITKAGTITIKVTTAAHTVNGTPYAAGEATAVLTVSKGTPAYTVPTGLTATYGDTLADVTLPTAENGTWAWNDAPTTKVGDAGERIHKATFTPTATDLWNTVEADVIITVSKATITLEGVAATYLDNEAKTVFTYGQTITVKATPAMPMTMALSFDEPKPNQMALFYGDTQISAPADADTAGTYTMTYQTTDKVLPIGDSKIRVKYVGTNNISDGTFDLTVTLEKANLTVSSVTLKDRAYEPRNSQVEVTAATLSGIIASDEVLADTAKMRCILKANGEMTDKVGEYTEVILPAEIPLTGAHAAYYTAKGGKAIAATVSITKATPVANGTPDFENVTPGTALKDVPTNAIADLYKPVEGTVTWKEPDATVEPGKEYEYTFTPKDTENYESVTGTTVIIPVAPPQPVVPPVVLPTVTVPTEAQLVTVCEGETADMSVTAINATAYQWYINRNDGLGWRPIIGANAPAYTTGVTTLDADGFLYLCRVSNADGAVNSPVFTLDVVPALDVPPTGDNTPVMLLAAMLFLSAAGLVIMTSKKRSFN